MEVELDAESAPYSKRESWKDVTPVPQDDGPEPLAVIRYSKVFEEVHSYFRAIQQLNEYSDRALKLTSDVIEQNSANYTAWYYRRQCLKELRSDLIAELAFTDKWARDCPKNYQVWYHRRWLISEIKDGMGDAEEEVRALGERELEYHSDVMDVNDDFKNYNGWSHRFFIVSKFSLWDKEIDFVENLLREDIRNNSAWNHRYTVVKKTQWPLTDVTRNREIQFTMKAIRECANNESAWNYLAAFHGEGDGKVAWNSVPEVEALCDDVLAASVDDARPQCRFAVEALAQIHTAKGDIAKATNEYTKLKEIDKIREKYWEWRLALLTSSVPDSTGSNGGYAVATAA